MTSRTNDEWAVVIATKVAEILADTSSPDSNVISGIAEPNAAFAATIDHTLLKPDATTAQIDELCAEAVKWGFKVCKSYFESDIAICDFPSMHLYLVVLVVKYSYILLYPP